MKPILRPALLLAPLFLATTSQGQSVAGPVRQLPAPVATSSEVLGSLAAIRQLPGGNILVNDQVARRLLLLDSDLKLIRVVADSTPNTNTAYGGRSGGLLPFRGDSALFVDPTSLSLLVISGDGKIVRTMAAPRPNEIGLLLGGNQTSPAVDARGRLVYRGARAGGTPSTPGAPATPPDTNPLVRVDLATRKLDTVAFFKVQKAMVSISRDAQGNISNVSVVINNVLPLVDEWTVMTDGTVAIVRGQDYRVDFYDAGNTLTRGPKIPYDWERLTDELKTAVIDSTRAFRERARSQVVATSTTMSADGRVTEQRVSVTDGGKSVAAASPGGGAAPPQPIILPTPSELPDYRPAFGVASVRADMDGRIWVRTTAVLQSGGGAIYDIIDRAGTRVGRVQVPVGVTIAGFGASGAVYFATRDDAGVHLHKAVAK